MTLTNKLLALFGISPKPRVVWNQPAAPVAVPTAPKVFPWVQSYDGMKYDENTNRWNVVDDKTVEWRGHSRPRRDDGTLFENANYVEAEKPVLVPAGAKTITFVGRIRVTSNDVAIRYDPVIGGLRIQVGATSSLTQQIICYRAPIENDNTISNELEVQMDVVPGTEAILRLVCMSRAGGEVRFENLRYVFS